MWPAKVTCVFSYVIWDAIVGDCSVDVGGLLATAGTRLSHWIPQAPQRLDEDESFAPRIEKAKELQLWQLWDSYGSMPRSRCYDYELVQPSHFVGR